jgi:hypothetical protein
MQKQKKLYGSSRFAVWCGCLFAIFALTTTTFGQGRPPAAAPPLSPKAAAVIDITGYWVAIVNEDWPYRMITPAKGDYLRAIPLNAEGRRVAGLWDPEKDKAEGNECKAYGAGGIMRLPGRLHITWADEKTMQMDIDAGTQKRIFHFDDTQWPGGDPQLQGFSVAKWEKQLQKRADPFFGGPTPGKGGDMKVVTTHMRPGYLEKNGVPYSGNATLTEYYDLVDLHGTAYLIMTSIFIDPMYLRDPFVMSQQYRREPDASKWNPTPCQPLWPITLQKKINPGNGDF